MANIPVRVKFETGITLNIAMSGVANAAGCISAQVGVNDATLATAGSNVQRYRMKVITKSGTGAPTAGGTYEFYLIRSNGVTQNAGFGVVAALWSDSTLRDQLEFIGAVTVTNTANKSYDVDFYFYNPGPYIQIGFWNGTSATNSATGADHTVVIYPETDTLVA